LNIVNNKVISVKDRKDLEAQPVWASSRLGGNNASQRWRVVYTDKMGEEEYTGKGKLDKTFNFLANEPFYFRSKLPMQRVTECVGASNIVLKKWYKNRKAQ
jgi:hypothetical protein